MAKFGKKIWWKDSSGEWEYTQPLVAHNEEFWAVPEVWKNDTAFIIGGGPSVNNIDFEPLKPRHIIGCNDAYCLGYWVDVCIFSEMSWFEKHNKDFIERPDGTKHKGLKKFPNTIVSSRSLGLKFAPQVKALCDDNTYGLASENWKLRWNYNTGFAGINLAIHLGATKIILLGFEFEMSNIENTNWHTPIKNPPRQTKPKEEKWDYAASRIVEDLKTKFPDVDIINSTPNSKLEHFPKMSLQEAIRYNRQTK